MALYQFHIIIIIIVIIIIIPQELENMK